VATALLPGVVLAAVLPAMASLAIAVVLGIALNVVEARVRPTSETRVARGVALPEAEERA